MLQPVFALILTACFSMGQEATSEREVDLFPGLRACKEIGHAKLAYVREQELPPGVDLIFSAATCGPSEGA